MTKIKDSKNKKTNDKNHNSFKIILLFGIVSLLGDVIYEAARSINGQYLQTLGASAAIVGLVVGLGEFLGQGLRLLSGYLSDKTKAYWILTILGYGLLISIPLLALTGIWQIAAILLVTERIGKAIRSPARDTLLSQAAKNIGTGWGFAIHEFLDQIGALLGPLLLAVIFFGMGTATQTTEQYQFAYSVLWIPYLLLMLVLIATYFISRDLISKENYSAEKLKINKSDEETKSKVFWYYTWFTFLTTIGFINFAILGYHFKATNVLPDSEIPLLYAAAMIIDAIFALIIGKLYDMLKTKSKNESAGLLLLFVIPILTALIPILALLPNIWFILLGVLIWGLVMGAHETIMRAAIADITPISKRGTGYGIFTAVYGFAALIGGAAAGFLYDYSFSMLIAFIIITQIISLFIFFLMKKEIEKDSKQKESIFEVR